MGAEQSKAEERNRQRQEQTLQAMVQKMKQLEARLQTPPQPTRAPVEPAREASERAVHEKRQPPKLNVASVVSKDLEKPCSSRATQQVGVSPASQTSREASERAVHEKRQPPKLNVASVVSKDLEKLCSSRATQQVGVSPASQTSREASERAVHEKRQPPKLNVASVVSKDLEKPCSSRATQQVGVSPASQTSREASERAVHEKRQPPKLNVASVVSKDLEKPCSSRATQQVGVSPASQISREASERAVHEKRQPPKLNVASVVSKDLEKPCSSRATQQVGVSPASQTSREASERAVHEKRQPPKLNVASVVSKDLEKPCSSRATQQVAVSPASQASRSALSYRCPTIAPNNPFYRQRTEQLNTTREAVASTSHNTLYPNLDDAKSTLSGVAKVQPFVQQSSFSPSTSRATKEDFVFVDKNKNTGAVRLQPSAPPENTTPPVTKFYAKRDRSVSRTRKNALSNEEEELNCRTCRNKYGLNIFQCLNGHSSCRDCKERGLNCGACRQPISNMRNIALEAYVAEKKTVCPNKDHGCCLSFKIADIEFHLKECPFSDLVCPLAALAENCRWRGKISQMATHFEDKHQQHKSTVGAENTISDFRNNIYSLQLIELGNFKFLAHLLINQTADMIFMTVQLLGTSVSASKWRYEFHVYNKGDPRRKYQHTDVCDSHSTPVSLIFAESQCASIPISYAKSFSDSRNSLTYKIYIMKDVDNVNPRGRGGRRGRGRGRPGSASRGPCSEGSISPNIFDDY